MMEVIEFKTRIKNGNIRIPEKYKTKTADSVKVIIISEKIIRQADQADIIDDLLANPIKIHNFFPFARKEIYDRF